MKTAGGFVPRRDDGNIEVLEEILDKLELLVNLTALQVASEKSITEAARQLKMAGLDNQTIASVLNTSPATIRVVTSNLRIKRLKLGGRRG
jgi:DNA-binding NarL/FixJ family response regulator